MKFSSKMLRLISFSIPSGYNQVQATIGQRICCLSVLKFIHLLSVLVIKQKLMSILS